MKIFSYRVAPGRVVIPPRSQMPGPGGFPLRYDEGETIDLTEEQFSRYWRNRIRIGDLIEGAPAPSLAAAVAKKDVTP